MIDSTVTRRDFIRVTAVVGGGLLVGFRYSDASAQPVDSDEGADAAGLNANAWIQIAPSGAVTFTCGRSEMGQDVYTSLSMILAEELGVDPRKVTVLHAPADPAYVNTAMGAQITGGSTSIREGWGPLRKAGATTREMLIAAAAAKWGAPVADCKAANGMVTHGPHSASYGSLASAAALLTPPGNVTLKDPAAFTVIGKPLPRLDGAAKARGRATYGMDIKLPGMLYAAIIPCPVIGGKVASFDGAAVGRRPGVKAVVNIGDAVAVVANHYWTARSAADSLLIKWDEGSSAKVDTASVFAALDAAKDRPGFVAKTAGNVSTALAAGGKTAEYRCQMLAHATLEPQNCTAKVTPAGVDVWASMQFPQGAQGIAASVAGVKPEMVKVHSQFIGGGFGRRLENDFVGQAVAIAKAVPGIPVQMIWTRPQDTQQDFYRPPSLHVMKGLIANGRLEALSGKLISPSVTARAFPSFVVNGNDPFMTEGLANVTYDVPNLEMRTVIEEVGVRVGYWRSVSHALNAFAVESFMDEMAMDAGQSPVAFRLALLQKMPRQRVAIERAVQASGYTATPAAGRAFGLASMECYGTHAAVVCEVSGTADAIKLEKITIAADCGIAVHPDQVVHQLQGGVVTGLIQAVRSKVTFKNGRVEQTNFDNFRLPRGSEVPPIKVELIASGEAPGGIGEVGTPLVAPALANAVFALTGKRIRTTPLEDGGVRFV
jgi:isoquinoline 1-oxidoreductase subunit beta